MNSLRSYFTKFICVMFALFITLVASQHPTAMAGTTTNLIRTSWQLVSLGNPENPLELVSDTTITAEFSEDRVTGSGGCNSYRATYKTSDNKITISSAASTERACAPQINEQESRYFEALAGAKRYQLTSSGQLEIFYETDSLDGVLVFANRNSSTVNLTGTSWKLIGFKTSGNLSEPIIGRAGRTLTAEFAEDRVGGSGGCNSYGATYQTNGSKLSITSLFSTRIGCVEEILEQEQRYFAALTGGKSYLLNEYGQLEISYQNKTESGVLVFEPQQTEE